MISRCTSPVLLLLAVLSISGLQGCSSSTSSSLLATQVSMYAAPSPATASVMPAGSKTITNTEYAQIVINKAYLVIASTTIETECDASFTAGLKHIYRNVLDTMVPSAYAHTVASPTSTGEPHVINLLAADNVPVAIGGMSPSINDYCGVDVDMFAADADTLDLPTGADDPDMVGKTLYIEATYTLEDTVTTGSFVIDTSAALQNRTLLLNALLMISKTSPKGTITIGINYDTWFDGVDLVALDTETMTSTDPNSPQVSQLLQNITASLHQL